LFSPSHAAGGLGAPLRAGAGYFAAVFALGFALGTARTVALYYAQHFALYSEPTHAVGLAAQIAFAAIPLLQRQRPALVPVDRQRP